MTADGAHLADGVTRRGEARGSAGQALWFVLLALANVLGVAILYYATAKGQDALSRYGFSDGCHRAGPRFQQIPVDPLPRTMTTCGKPFARPFWGLGVAPVLAMAVSGFVMFVLYDRRQRRAAVLQTGFFIVALATAVFGVTRLLEFWT